jgi:ATP-dependent Clp protease ATP-binding subunit ClpB
VDETIVFHNLTPAQLARIVDIQIQRLGRRLADRQITLELSEGAKKLLAEKGYDPVYGARPLKRAIQRYLENPLSLAILEGNIGPGSQLRADEENGAIVFQSQAV